MRILVLLIHFCMVELVLVHDVLNKYGCGSTKLCIFNYKCIFAQRGRVLKDIAEDDIDALCTQGVIIRPFNLTADGKNVEFYHVVLWWDKETAEISLKNHPTPFKCTEDTQQIGAGGVRFTSSKNVTLCTAHIDYSFLDDRKPLELSDGQETLSGNVEVKAKVDELKNACPAVALVIVIFICRHRRRQKPLPPPKKEEELEEVSCRGPLTTPKGGDDKPKDPPAKEASKAEEKKGIDMNEILLQMQKDLNELREENKDRLREANDTAAFINIAASDRDEAEMMLSEGCYKAEFGVENLTDKDVITVFHKLDTKKYKHYTIIPASQDIEQKAIEMFTIKFDGQSKDRVKDCQFKVKKKRGVISALKRKLDMSLELKWPEEHTNNSQPSDLPDEINVSMEDKEKSCKGGSNKSLSSRSSKKDGASVKEEKTQAD